MNNTAISYKQQTHGAGAATRSIPAEADSINDARHLVMQPLPWRTDVDDRLVAERLAHYAPSNEYAGVIQHWSEHPALVRAAHILVMAGSRIGRWIFPGAHPRPGERGR